MFFDFERALAGGREICRDRDLASLLAAVGNVVRISRQVSRYRSERTTPGRGVCAHVRARGGQENTGAISHG